MTKSCFPSVLIPLVCLHAAVPLRAAVEIIPEKELLITDVRVVDSPRAQYPDGLHIKPRRAGQASELSAFLLPEKLKVKDPSNNRTEIYTELQDRAEMLSILLEEKPRSQKRKLEELSQKRLRRSH